MNKKTGFSSADKATDNLLKAVGKYIDANGGNALVAGGIGIIHEGKYRFKIVIGVTGSPPPAKKGCKA